MSTEFSPSAGTTFERQRASRACNAAPCEPSSPGERRRLAPRPADRANAPDGGPASSAACEEHRICVERGSTGSFVRVSSVVVDPGREVARAGGERGHVGLQRAACRRAPCRHRSGRRSRPAGSCPGSAGAGPPAGGRTSPGRRTVSGRRCGHAACASVAPASNASWVEFHLLGDRDRHGRVVRLPRQGAGDGDRDDAGLGHGISARFGWGWCRSERAG